jgi:hypothetical protein
MDGTLSFRAEDETADQWSPHLLKRNYPMALPVFSVNTEQEADRLIRLSASLGWDNKRYGVPGVLRPDTIPEGRGRMRGVDIALGRVTEHLDEWYRPEHGTMTHAQASAEEEG